MSEKPPPYSPAPGPTMGPGQIVYSAASAPVMPAMDQGYAQPHLPPQPAGNARPEVKEMGLNGAHCVATVTRVQQGDKSSKGSKLLRFVMLVVLVVAIPAGGSCWYYGSVSADIPLKTAGICIQGLSFVVVELLQLLWYYTEKNAFLRANVTVVRSLPTR